MQRVLRPLRKCILACHSRAPAQLRIQLSNEEQRIIRASGAFGHFAEAASNDTPRVLELLHDDGTVLAELFQLLDRVLDSLPPDHHIAHTAQQAALLANVSSAEVTVLSALLSVFTGFINILSRHHPELNTTSPVLVALAAAQPLRVLATALNRVTHLEQLLDPTRSSNQLRVHQIIREQAVISCSALLALATGCAPLMAALGPQLATPSLWGPACRAAAAPHMAHCANALAVAFTEIRGASAHTLLTGCHCPSAPAIADALAGEAAFWTMLVRRAALRTPRPSRAVADALFSGMCPQEGVASLPGLFGFVTQDVIDVAAAMPGDGPPRTAELCLVLRLFECLEGHLNQQRAFLAVAACAERALTVARSAVVEESPVLAASDGRDSVADFCHFATTMPAKLLRAAAASQLDPGASSSAVDAEHRGLTSRARWMAQRGMVGKCEALLRAAAAGGTGLQRPMFAGVRCALNAAVLLLDDGQLGVGAVQACLSLFATQRKLMVRWIAAQAAAPADAAAVSTPPTAACVSSLAPGSRNVLGAAAATDKHDTALPTLPSTSTNPAAGDSARCQATSSAASGRLGASNTAGPPCGASSDPQPATSLSSAPAAATAALAGIPCRDVVNERAAAATCVATARPALCDTTDWAATCGSPAAVCAGPTVERVAPPLGSRLAALAGCVEVCAVLHSSVTLRTRAAAECPAADGLLSSCSAQLMPLIMRAASRLLRARLPCAEDAGTWQTVLTLIRDLNSWGMLNLTASVGAPALIARLLHALRNDLPESVFLLNLAISCVHLGASSDAWLLETARLSLLEALAACAASLQADVALAALFANTAESSCMALLAQVCPATACPLGGQADTEADALHRHFGNLVRAAACEVCEYQERTDELEASLIASGTPCAPHAATWDRCLLAARTVLAGEAGLERTAWVGCCYRGCTNLCGESEETLKLKACKGCRLARYCSLVCQRKAWRSGHRSACLEWQTQEVLSPGHNV